MASVKIVLKENQAKKDGTYPVLIRVIADRRAKYISTGYSVKKTQFRPGTENWVVKHSDAVLINAGIESKRAKIAASIYLKDIEGKKFEIEDIGDKKSRYSFFTAVKEKMNALEGRNQVAMYNRLRARLKLLKQAWGKDVLLADLDKKWVEKYIKFRMDAGNKVSTIKKDLGDFSVVINSVEGYKGENPFHKAQSTLKAEKPVKIKLTLQEIRSMETTKLSGLNDVARDMFLFAFYTHGMRFENVATFKTESIKNGVLSYRMNKAKKLREIQVHPKLQAIIDKYKGKHLYLFPVVKQKITDNWVKKEIIGSATALINANLKRVAIICGIDKPLTTHIARHTFASLSLKRNVSRDILKDALGHSSYAVTEMYLDSLSDDDINEAVKGLYD